MRRPEDFQLDPEVEAALDAIDATLAGEPVDPSHAELAELALLVSAQRPRPTGGLSERLDERVAHRFSETRVDSPQATGRPGPGRRRRAWRRPLVLGPAAGLTASIAVAVAIVAGGGPGQGPGVPLIAAPSVGARGVAHPLANRPKTPSAAHRAASGSAAASLASRPSAAPSRAYLPPAGSSAGSGSSPAGAQLQPPTGARKVIQSAQLQLATRPRLIDQVSQEVFDVVGREHGIVNASNVTAGGPMGGYAQFQLSVPSSNLSQTMASLSTLAQARVLSRTDSTQDVNDSYHQLVRRLGDARALRGSLLRQLAAATTQGAIDSLTVRLHATEARISEDERALASLRHQIAYSQISLTLNAAAMVVAGHRSAGFTLGRAAHDAVRVLTVAAGVALIGLAALVPVALLVALAWWIGSRVRQRRRLQALDLA